MELCHTIFGLILIHTTTLSISSNYTTVTIYSYCTTTTTTTTTTPIELTTKGFQWESMDGQVQHDAHELNRLLIDAIEKSLKRTTAESLCKSLYQGVCANQIQCLNCKGISERTEPYYDINLQILDCCDIHTSLRKYTAAELLTGDSAYQCDTCQRKCDANRNTIVRTLPPVS